METLTLLATCIVAVLADSVTLLKRSEVTTDLINNPRYILYENRDGLIEVEDLTVNTTSYSRFVPENDVSFWVYTRKNPNLGIRIWKNQLADISRFTQFNTRLETLVIIHGWRNDINSSVNSDIKNAAFQSRDVNVIVVDWSPIASKQYVTARYSVIKIGNYVGDFLTKLTRAANYRWNEITVVGYSLGAHIAGNAGARTKSRIETIIGLDPAGPFFSQLIISDRLDPTDAKHVQVIHTFMTRLGCLWKSGDVDYYPDGGKWQSGCGTDLLGECSHSRSYMYYAESLRSNAFLSRSSESWNNYKRNRCNRNRAGYMGGYPVRKVADGNYYLRVNSKSPFGQG